MGSLMVNEKTVYVETSVVSYLTARPSNDLLVAAWQKITVDWWDIQRNRFDLYTSGITIDEAGRGNSEAASRRLETLSDISILPVTEAVADLSKAFLEEKAFPTKALNDSLHVAVSAVHGIDYLLTWNFRHIDNAEIKPVIRRICAMYEYTSPEICTPQELMGDFKDV